MQNQQHIPSKPKWQADLTAEPSPLVLPFRQRNQTKENVMCRITVAFFTPKHFKWQPDAAAVKSSYRCNHSSKSTELSCGPPFPQAYEMQRNWPIELDHESKTTYIPQDYAFLWYLTGLPSPVFQIWTAFFCIIQNGQQATYLDKSNRAAPSVRFLGNSSL